MEPKNIYLKQFEAKEQAVKFGRLAGALESLINYAEKAKAKAEEMEGSLKILEGQYIDMADLISSDDASDIEWRKELAENIARGEKELADPLKEGGRGYPGMSTLLSLIKDYADHDNFASPLLERANAEDDEARKLKHLAK